MDPAGITASTRRIVPRSFTPRMVKRDGTTGSGAGGDAFVDVGLPRAAGEFVSEIAAELPSCHGWARLMGGPRKIAGGVRPEQSADRASTIRSPAVARRRPYRRPRAFMYAAKFALGYPPTCAREPRPRNLGTPCSPAMSTCEALDDLGLTPSSFCCRSRATRRRARDVHGMRLLIQHPEERVKLLANRRAFRARSTRSFGTTRP